MLFFRFYHDKNPKPEAVTARIQNDLYEKIHASVPIVCADLVIRSGKEFLLLKRANKPCRDHLFLPGGRVLKNEALAKAALRKLREETGLRARKAEFLAVAEHFGVKGYFPGQRSHIISFVFLVEAKKTPLRLDRQSSEGKWLSRIPRGLHPYPKAMLRLANFK